MANTPVNHLGLFTDLYELTMLQAYLAERMTDTAVFTLFVRRLKDLSHAQSACIGVPEFADETPIIG